MDDTDSRVRYSLFLSPHPDDLVFSTFSALIKSKAKLAVIYFNVSRFTRWPLESKTIISAYRTLEDKIILSFLGVKTSYLFLDDTSIDPVMEKQAGFREGINLDPPAEIYCPLGVGGNLNHIFVRARGMELGRFFKETKLFFYEDLPYSARTMHEDSVEKRLQEVSSSFNSLEPIFQPLSGEEMKKKLLLSRAYLSQNDHRRLLSLRGRSVGRECSRDFAEKYYLAT